MFVGCCCVWFGVLVCLLFCFGLVAGDVDFLVYGCFAVLAVDLFACDLVLVGVLLFRSVCLVCLLLI